MKLYYSDAYVGSRYAFDTTRKAGWLARSLTTSPIYGVTLAPPAPATRDQLARVHDHDYIQAVKTGRPRGLAESQGFAWDPGLWNMVCASTGGAIAAALTAMEDGVAGSLSSGLHHARAGEGRGFCTFNGLAAAAFEALDRGAGRVLILDFDAHCGGGTHSIISGQPGVQQLDIAVNSFDSYLPDPPNRLRVVSNGDFYLSVIETELSELEASGARFGLCLYNAGMDPFERCEVGGLRGVGFDDLRARERLVFDWCRRLELPAAFVLAGGYVGGDLDEAALAALHRLTIDSAVEA